jgi:protein FrlC
MIKFSYNTWPYSSFLNWVPSYPLEYTIKRLAAIGYDGIEIGAAAPHAYPAYLTPERRREIRKVLDDSGIALSSMLCAPSGGRGNNPASPDVAERRSTVEHYKEIIDLAEEWGGHIVLYLPGWVIFGTRRRQAWAWSRECVKEIADHAAKHDVTLAIEPLAHDSNLCEGAEDAMELMEDVGHPNLKLMFDGNHVMYLKEIMSDYVYLMGKDLKHVHISDNDRLPPGQGVGDWESFVDALLDIEFDGYLTMETGFHERGIHADRDARMGLQYLKPLVERKIAERRKKKQPVSA